MNRRSTTMRARVTRWTATGWMTDGSAPTMLRWLAIMLGLCVLAVAGFAAGRYTFAESGTPGSAQVRDAQGSGEQVQLADPADPGGYGDSGDPAQTSPAVPTREPPAPPLQEGMTGTEVADLQRSLHGLGYQVRQVTGRYDNETAHAVLAFEKLHGLPRDGVADAAMRAALAQPDRPRARGATPGLRMEVDLRKQVTYVVRDGAVIRIYDVSTGAAQSPTPAGDFTVQYKIDGWRYAELGPLWRPVYFTHTGIAFHGGEPVLPQPGSHGCVRMTDPSINELFGQLAPGVPVAVY